MRVLNTTDDNGIPCKPDGTWDTGEDMEWFDVDRKDQCLMSLPGQPLCKHYTGQTLAWLRGDYSIKCQAGIPYDRWVPDMDRWPCRRRHTLGLEQHDCYFADYGSDLPSDSEAAPPTL